MGTRAHLLVEGPPEPLPAACREVERLERLWTRFEPDSDVSRLNAAAGEPVAVEAETVELLARAEQGWRISGGLFDPTLLNEVVAAGYDRDFAAVRDGGGGPAPPSAPPRPGGGAYPVELDQASGTARLAAAVGFDSGGIGKGLAADLVAEGLRAAGAERALVNLGGDLRAAGPAGGKPWRVGIDNPFDPRGPAALRLELSQGGLATSTSLVRRWRQDGEERHHLIDPRTGRPADSELASATVIADRGWKAEALAKAAFLSPPARALELLAANGCTGLVVDREGRIHPAPGLEAHLATPLAQVTAASLKQRPVSGRARVRIPPAH